MSKEQRAAVDQLARHPPLDLGGDVAAQRAVFARMIAGIPLAGDVVSTPGTLGGIPVVGVDVTGVASADVLFFAR
jgi:monoterpene epsilon-lactone hydrolase